MSEKKIKIACVLTLMLRTLKKNQIFFEINNNNILMLIVFFFEVS